MSPSPEARKQVDAWIAGLSPSERTPLSTHSITALQVMLTYHAQKAVDVERYNADHAAEQRSDD